MTEAELAPRLRAQYASGPARWIVVLFVNDAGEVAWYRVGMAIMDSPIAYYRADGTPLGVFHIFGDPAENARAQTALDELRATYPIERPFAP